MTVLETSDLTKKRFIAGAECPACKSIDTIYLLANELNGAFECEACGHREEPPKSGPAPAETLEADISTVKFVDVSKL